MLTAKQLTSWYWLPCRMAVHTNIALCACWLIIIMYVSTGWRIHAIEQILDIIFNSHTFTAAVITIISISWLIQFIYFFILQERVEYKEKQLRYPRDINRGRYLYYTIFLPQLLFVLVLLVFTCDAGNVWSF